MKSPLHYIFLTLFLFTIQMTAFAHGDKHGKVLPENEIKTRAQKVIKKAIENGVLKPSWEDATLQKIEAEHHGNGEWKLHFTNPKALKQQSLFIYFSLEGQYKAMNFKGN